MRCALFLLPAVLFGLIGPALGADPSSQICHGIAAMLRDGFGNRPEHGTHQTLLETLAHNSHGRLALANWQSQGDQRESYLHASGMQSEDQPMTAAVRADRLVGVMTVDGSANCMHVWLFQSTGHRLVQIVEPYVTRITSCQRWGDSIFLGNLEGRPFVAKETNHDMEIQVAPWSGHAWNPVCSVAIEYVPKLISEGSFCRAANCKRTEAEAKRIAGQMRSEGIQDVTYQVGSNPQLDHLVELAGRTPETDEIPAAPNWLASNFTPRLLAPYMATVDGQPTLALGGEWKGGPAVDSESIGYAVAFWQGHGDKLVPIAGFHLRTAHSRINSVLVTH